MSEHRDAFNSSNASDANLLDLLITLGKHKKMIISVTLIVALTSAGISLMRPNIYAGTARILAPQNPSSANAIFSQAAGVTAIAGGLPGIKNPNELYVAMLKSRTVMENIATRFDLMKTYEQETVFDTLKALDANAKVFAGKDGIITVEVDDKEPKRAAGMANAFVEELNKLLQALALTDASQKRIFFEQQLKQAKDKLTDAEFALDRTPNTSLKYMDVVRNLKYCESVYEILAKQFEMAKLEEAKDYPMIQVLDRATPPEIKSRPKRGLIVLTCTFIAFVLAVIWAFIRESMLRAEQHPEQAARLLAVRTAFKW